MQFIALILGIALTGLFWAMWVRFIVELTRSVNPSWRPQGVILVIAELSLTITDPLVKTLRKILPQLRFGGLALDFGWTVGMLAIVIAQNLVAQIR